MDNNRRSDLSVVACTVVETFPFRVQVVAGKGTTVGFVEDWREGIVKDL